MIDMLLTQKQAKHLESAGEGKFRFVDDGTVTKKEKQKLLDLDAGYFEIYGYHIITNLEDLKK